MSRKNKKTNKTLKTLKAKRLKKAEGGNITPQQLTQGIKDLQEGKITPQQLQAMSSQLAKQTTAMQQGMNNPAPAENVLAPVETAPPVTTAPPPEETAAVKSENLYTTQADTAANTTATPDPSTTDYTNYNFEDPVASNKKANELVAQMQAGEISVTEMQAWNAARSNYMDGAGRLANESRAERSSQDRRAAEEELRLLIETNADFQEGGKFFDSPHIQRYYAQQAQAENNATSGTSQAPVTAELKRPDAATYAAASSTDIQDDKEGNITADENIKTVTAPTTASTGDAISTTDIESTASDVKAATTISNKPVSTITADTARTLAATEAVQGTVSNVAQSSDATLTERAQAATRVSEDEQAAQAQVQAEFNISPNSMVPQVNAQGIYVSPTPEAEKQIRKVITESTLSSGEAAKIIGVVGFEASQRRTVTGTAAKGAAASMLEVVGELPAEITAAIVEDPATVVAALGNETVEVSAAIAALPTEALVSSQMDWKTVKPRYGRNLL